MDLLQAYNQILRANGEEPINDFNTPDYTVPLIRSQFEVVKRSVLAQGFSFNTDKVTLTPDSNSQLVLPVDAIYVRFQSGKEHLNIRGRKVWDNSVNNYASKSEEVLIVRDLPFENIPEAFQQWIVKEIAAEVRFSSRGVDAGVQYLRAQANKARAVALNSEPAELDGSTGWGALLAAYGA